MTFNTAKRPARPSDWMALLEAVLHADPEDESIALEWKSTLDLTDNIVLARSVARIVLGMANRSVEDSRRHFDGSGVLIVGLEPGTVHGVDRIDPAQLDQRLAKYIGPDGPGWEPRYFTVDDKPVLVLEVAAPQPGDRIFALRTTYSWTEGKKTITVPEGTVWVRHGGRTPVATQGDYDMLHRRAQTSSAPASLDISVTCTPNEVSPYIWLESNVENWLDGRRRVLLQSLEDTKRMEASKARPLGGVKASDEAAVASWLKVSGANGLSERVEEKRTEAQFQAQVEAWITNLRESMKAVPGAFGAYVGLVPMIEVHNATDENFTEVVVRLSMEGAVQIEELMDEAPLLSELLPAPPRKFGPWHKSKIPNFAADAAALSRITSQSFLPRGPRTERINGGSFQMNTVPVNLRPGETEVIEADTVILVPQDRTDPLVMHWTATATNVRGRAQDDIVLQRGPLIDIWSTFLAECESQGWPKS